MKVVGAPRLASSLSRATSSLNSAVANIEAREANLSKQQANLASLNRDEIARTTQLENYSSQIFEQSKAMRAENETFYKSVSQKERDIQLRIEDANARYGEHIRNLRNIEHQKAELQTDIGRLSQKIESAEKEQHALEQRDARAELQLFEYVTKPFSRLEISEALTEGYLSEVAAVKTLLRLHLGLIHDLRMRISEEKLKRKVQKGEFKKLLGNVETVVIDRSEEERCLKVVDKMRRRLNRIEREMSEIAELRPVLKMSIASKKGAIKKAISERDRFEGETVKYKAEFNPKYNAVIREQIARIKEEEDEVARHIKRRRRKCKLLNEKKLEVKQKIRELNEIELEMDHVDLTLQAEMNQTKREYVEAERKAEEDGLLEQQLVTTLADLQKEIAIRSAEFDQMVEAHRVVCEEKLVKPSQENEKTLRRMKQDIDKTKKESLLILAEVRNLLEKNAYAQKELRTAQAQLHLESYRKEKLKLKQDRQVKTRDHGNTVAVELLKDRIQRIRDSNKARQTRVDTKSDLLRRIESVNDVGSHLAPFLVEDTEKVIDRLDLRKRRLAESAQRVERAVMTVNRFSELYRVVKAEIARWVYSPDEGDKLNEWVSQLALTCRSFRDCGV